MKDKSKKYFRTFGTADDENGISNKNVDLGNGVKRFFVTFKNNFGKIISVNLIMIFGNFPIFFLICALFGVTKTESYLPMHDVFGNLAFLFADGNADAHSMALFAISGLHSPVLLPTALTYAFYGLGALTLLTFGCVNVGTAYVLRNIAEGGHVSVRSDFWYAVRCNWKQALPFGVIDLLINAMTVINVYNMISSGLTGFFTGFLMWLNVVFFVLFFFMRYYVYLQMVTFELTIWKILKNSFIFLLLGFKRNLAALLGIIITLVIEAVFIFAFRGILISLGVVAPLLILFAAFAYMMVFAAYFKLKEIMIDPYLTEDSE